MVTPELAGLVTPELAGLVMWGDGTGRDSWDFDVTG